MPARRVPAAASVPAVAAARPLARRRRRTLGHERRLHLEQPEVVGLAIAGHRGHVGLGPHGPTRGGVDEVVQLVVDEHEHVARLVEQARLRQAPAKLEGGQPLLVHDA